MTETTQRRGNQIPLLACTVIFSFAFAFYAFLIFDYLPNIHFAKYSRTAQLFLNGDLASERLIDFSPLYLQIHVFAQRFLPNAPLLLIWYLQILLVSLSAVFLFLILARFFRNFVALAGTIAFLVDRSLIVYAHDLEPEIFVIFFLIASVYFAQLNAYGASVLAGVFLTLCILTRPTFLPALLFFPVNYFFNCKNHGRWRIATLLFVLPVTAGLASIWIRNIGIIGNFSPLVMNPGTTIFEGNNPNSQGLSAIYPPLFDELSSVFGNEPDYQHELYRLFARRITGTNLTVPAVNQYWISKSVHFLRDHPGHSLRLLATKMLNSFHDYNWHDLASAYWSDKRLAAGWIPTVPFAVISAMALIGMIVQRSNWKRCLLMYVLFFCQIATMLMIYVSARQRVSISWVFVFFASATLQFVLIHKRQIFLMVPLVIGLSLLLHIRTDPMKEEDHLWESMRTSNQALTEAYRKRDESQFKEAAAISARSLAAAPWLIDTRRPADLSFQPDGFAFFALKVLRPTTFSERFDYATLAIQAGSIEEAKKNLNQLKAEGYRFKRDYYQSSEPYFYLGRAAEIQNDTKQAEKLMKIALEHSPGDPSVLAHLAALTNRDEYLDRLFRYFDDIDANLYLGKAYLSNNQAEKAVNSFSYVVEKVPEFRNGWIYLAASLAQTGRLEEAAARYRRAIQMHKDPVLLEDEILGVFKKLSEINSADSFAKYSYGVVVRQYGHFEQAIQIQKEALKMSPNSEPIRAEMMSLKRVVGR